MQGGARTPEAFAPAIAALGSAAFAAELLAALNRIVPVDHLSLMRFADGLAITLAWYRDHQDWVEQVLAGARA